MSAFESLLDQLIQGLKDIRTTHMSHLAAGTIIAYDHLITLDQEITLIWRGRLSLSRIIFVASRYYTLATVIFNNYAFFRTDPTDTVSASYLVSTGISTELPLLFSSQYSCRLLYKWQGWTAVSISIMAQIILQMRIYALYSLNKRVLVLMLATFLASMAASSWIMGKCLASFTAIAFPIPGGKFCLATGIPSFFYAFWIPIICFESLLCAMALYRSVQESSNRSGSLFRRGQHLVDILIRDSVFYFVIVGATYFMSMYMWRFARPTLLEVPTGFSTSMPSIITNRFVLEILGYQKDNNHISSGGSSRRPLRGGVTLNV